MTKVFVFFISIVFMPVASANWQNQRIEELESLVSGLETKIRYLKEELEEWEDGSACYDSDKCEVDPPFEEPYSQYE